MNVNKVQTGLRLPRPMYAKIKMLAEQDSRTVNNLLELILKNYIEGYEREHGEIQTANK